MCAIIDGFNIVLIYVSFNTTGSYIKIFIYKHAKNKSPLFYVFTTQLKVIANQLQTNDLRESAM